MDFRHKQTKAVQSVTGPDAEALKKDPDWERIESGEIDESAQMPAGVQQPPQPVVPDDQPA